MTRKHLTDLEDSWSNEIYEVTRKPWDKNIQCLDYDGIHGCICVRAHQF